MQIGMQLGIDRLLSDSTLQAPFTEKRLALVGHPASVTSSGQHSLDALIYSGKFNITAAFGPQHGMRGDKQDNMIESENYLDPQHNIPVFSLYGEVRRPTAAMLDSFDVLLIDIQDIGCRIYTYITTLLYLLEACAAQRKPVVILDRPNPAGREIEGLILRPGWESFVGADEIIMRHGLTMAEMARWFIKTRKLDVELHIIGMNGYQIKEAPGYGWPLHQLAWVNPSPNASSLNMTRCYAGTVLLEGTSLSEGRGTTVALEIAGAPDIKINDVLNQMQSIASHWMQGAILRPCFFEPTFHKHTHKLCQGFQLHTDFHGYVPAQFKPYRLILLFLKSIYMLYPDYPLWRIFDYEYETERLPFDVINGCSITREWVEDNAAVADDLEVLLSADENKWREDIQDCLLYQ